MSDRDEFLDIAAAAQFLAVSETSLRRWTNSGALPCLRVGAKRERRFRRADLLAFMEAGRTAGDGDGKAARHDGAHTLIHGLRVTFGTHLCGLYESDAGRVDLACGFLAEGAKAGSVAFLIGPQRSRTAVLEALGAQLSVDEAIRRERLVTGDYHRTPAAQVAWFEAQFIAARERGARELRIVGDRVGLKRDFGMDGVLAYEASFEQHLVRRFPVVAMCQYDCRKFNGCEVLELLKLHHDSFGYPPRRWLA
jgi:transcriptional repressor of dcmA and dcmR